MKQAQGSVWPESRSTGSGTPGGWTIERQNAPVEDYLCFFPGQAGGRVYEQLLFNLPMNLQCMDGAGRILSVNKQWMDTLGYTQADVNGRHWHELLDQESRQRLTRDVYPRYFQSAVIRHVEIVVHRKDGKPANMLMSAHGYRGSKGHIERSIVILHEGTSRRSAETALQRSEERFRGAFDAAAHGIVLVAPNGRVLAHNPAFKDMSGRSEEELSNFAFDESIHADDKANFLSAMRGLIAGEVPSLKMELRYVGGKQLTWGFTSVSLVRNEREDIDHLVVQIVDTTSRRQAERQLQQAQKMEAVGQLTGRLAHDFNNMLTVIMGNLDLIELALKDDTKALARVTEAIEAARQGSELTKQLLSFSRQRDLEPKELAVNGLIASIAPLVERTLGETVELELALMETDAGIFVDPAQFETSIINLAINARDAMPSGGRLVLETRSIVLDQAYEAENPDAKAGSYVMIAATDSGGGIAKGDLDKVVQPFFTTKSHGRSGLGLAMVYGFATQSGGHLRVESEQGRGTTVRMFLPRRDLPAVASVAGPVAEPKARSAPEKVSPATAQVSEATPPFIAAAQAPVAPPSPAGDQKANVKTRVAIVATAVPAKPERKAKILVVEDQEGVREVAAGFLTEFGYEVIEAEDGIAALSLLQEHKDIDLMFSDVVMPGGLNGFDVAQAALQIIPDLLILHTSGYPKGAMVHSEEPRLKDNNIIMKPYRREELERAINEAFASKRNS